MSYRDWHVGMKVVCIEPVDDPESPNPAYGEVYTIAWIGVSCGDVMIDLVELPCPESEEFNRGYLAEGFRPVQQRKTSIEIFKRLLINPHVRIEEDA